MITKYYKNFGRGERERGEPFAKRFSPLATSCFNIKMP
ncbi:hypothetical protein DGI_1173 [Megalodesulfovibrio gigas DSM 1382 = ATCC 19364]|uniref:Uncharacterized protein n=1 Tax=Megalodesulfovibrio gigas (strain ATCC 19364 / DSM 1382 / NCIMB 9332 / VKM B-1759) TaxID=1121448 RepID=T2GA33_MEGG1|nr:hypothetical protein DGI_1173 [Megalodesulfovibrio gigas DSM 1382 = ATCC 19364]